TAPLPLPDALPIWTIPLGRMGRDVHSRALARSAHVSAGVENTSRKVSTAPRGSGERRFSRRLRDPVSADPFRAIVTPAATAFRVIRTDGTADPSPGWFRARRATSSLNTGSVVYWAMPNPRTNGK